MFRSKEKRHNAANAAILQTARLFAELWGEAEQAENGDVHFAGLPHTLHGLTATQTWQRQPLGGTMSVNLCLTREVNHTEHSVLRFRAGRFRHKGDGEMARLLVERLHADAVLMDALPRLDLAGLAIALSGGKASITLTPYGGGLAFLALPPVRYAVAFPHDQIGLTVRVLERLERIVGKQSETMASNKVH